MDETKGKQLENQVPGGLRGYAGIRNLSDPDRGPLVTTATPEVLLHPITKIESDRLPQGGAGRANGPRSRAVPTHSTPGPEGAGVERGEARPCLVNNRITPRKGRLKSVAACDAGAWTIASWRVKDPSKVKLRPFKCRTWRHEGECRQWAGAKDFVRCKEAIESRDDWVYIVLTFDPKEWPNEWEAYKQGGKMWNRLRSRLVRAYGKIDYIQTWERTQKGWPHVNIIIHNKEIIRECKGEGWRTWRQTLKHMAVGVGFGKVLWVEGVRDTEGMAGYMTKLSKELTGAMHKDQIPVNAPPHFRRLRASRGLLPAPAINHEGVWTGRMIQKSVQEIHRIQRTWGLDVETLADPGIWTVYRRNDEQTLEVETHYEVEVRENIIHEKMVQETRAG